MEFLDLKSAQELLEQLWNRRDPSRSFAGVPVGEGIPCYLLTGNFDKLKLFFFVLQIILNVFLIWGKVNKLREFSNLGLFAHTTTAGICGRVCGSSGRKTHGSRGPLLLSLNSFCHPWTREFFSY